MLINIESGQLIYANVEPKGFQTVFLTPGWLNPQEQQLLENRLLYDGSLCAYRPKYLYFTVGTDRRVVVRLIPRSGRDKYGRELMLAHALIIREDAWCKANLNPVRLFRQAPFINDLATATSNGDLCHGTIHSLQLTLPETANVLPLKRDSAIAAAQTWVIHDQERQSKRQVLARIVAPDDAEQNLEFLAQLCRQLPQDLQRLLTFNSCCKTIGDNSENRLDWFLLGLPKPDADYRVLTLNGNGTTPLPRPTETLHPYETWLQVTTTTTDADFATAWPVACWLAKQQSAESWRSTPHAVWQEVCMANINLLKSRFSEVTCSNLPPPLELRVMPVLNPQDVSMDRMQQFLDGISQATMMDIWFKAWLSPGSQRLSMEERRALATLILEPRWKAALFLANGQLPQAQQILRDLSEADYISLVDQLITRRYDAANLAVKGHIDAWLSACRHPEQTVPMAIIIAVLAEHEPEKLITFSDELDRLTDNEVRNLQRFVRNPRLPPPFAQRLQQRLDKLPGIWPTLLTKFL